MKSRKERRQIGAFGLARTCHETGRHRTTKRSETRKNDNSFVFCFGFFPLCIVTWSFFFFVWRYLAFLLIFQLFFFWCCKGWQRSVRWRQRAGPDSSVRRDPALLAHWSTVTSSRWRHGRRPAAHLHVPSSVGPSTASRRRRRTKPTHKRFSIQNARR